MKKSYTLVSLLVFTVITMILNLPCFAQSLQVIRYSENEGLSNTLVKSVTTDHQGLIWIGTDGGLFLFDGNEFSHFKGDLPSQYVKSVFCRKNGDVIVTTDLGIMICQASERPVALKPFLKGSVMQVDSLLWFPKGCYEDTKGRLWFGDNRKIYCLDERNVLNSYFPADKAVTNNFQRSFSFAEDGYGHLFSFAEPGYIFLFDPAENRFDEVTLPAGLSNIQFALATDERTILIATRTGLVKFTSSENGGCESLVPVAGSPEISCIYRFAPGKYYAGTWANGLYEINSDGQEYHVHHLDEIQEKNINTITGGFEGNVWIASDNGLLLLQRNLFASPYKSTTRDYIQCISSDSSGNTFFCDGNKVYRSSPAHEPYPSGSVSVIKSASATILQAVPADGGMWFADVNARIWYENPPGHTVRQFDFSSAGNAVFFLKKDRSGNLWACQDQNPSLIRISRDYEVRTYGAKEGITSRPLVTAMDGSGRIYAGGMADTAYLFAYDAGSDRFINLSSPINFEHNINININDMATGPDGVMWLGSSFGLLQYKNGEVTRVEFGQMTGSSVKAVTVDRNNNIWLGNSIGLHLYTGNELLSFDDRDGMESKIINYRCLHLDQDGRLWVGTVEGVMVSSPLITPKKTVTPVIFSVLINNREEINKLPAEIKFNSRSFANLKVGVLDYPYVNFRIEMFLEGRDSVWQPVPRAGNIILANLSPGKYTLMLRAAKTGNNLTSDLLRWDFTITRIWYTQGWVILPALVIVVLLFWAGIYLNTLKLKRYNEKLERAIKERTHETIIQKERIEAQNISIMQKNEELNQANIGLEKARIIAEEASEAQKKFLSVMTHELRTPLNAVIGAAHLLVRNNPRQDQFEDLQILRFSAENLLGLINNILDFTKIESGKVSLEKIGFNLRNLVEEIVSAMKIRAKEKNIEIGCHIDDQIPETLIGDPLRLSQIINNLMGNALKFTDSGTINVELVMRDRSRDEVVVDFMVCDTGIGMSKETMDSVFELFVQGSSETTRKYGGTGLGLVITQKLLELFGSKIQAESHPGVGTCFSFSIKFPVISRITRDISINRENYPFTPFAGQRVLLVEDNQVNKLIAGKFLKDWNLTVDSADNGLIALDMVKKEAYSLILMDLQMPEMDGYQASVEIRNIGTEPYLSIPIIALTAAARSDVSAQVFKSGMNDFISKPFNPVDLHLKIKSTWGKIDVRLHPLRNQVLLQYFIKIFFDEWFGKIIVHAVLETFFPVTLQGNGCQSDDRCVSMILFILTDQFCRLEAVKFRHVNVHEYKIDVMLLEKTDCLSPVDSGNHLYTGPDQHGNEQFHVDRIIFSDQDGF